MVEDINTLEKSDLDFLTLTRQRAEFVKIAINKLRDYVLKKGFKDKRKNIYF